MYGKYFQEIKRQTGSFNRNQLMDKTRKLAKKEAKLVSSQMSESQVSRFAKELVSYLEDVPEPLHSSLEKEYKKVFTEQIRSIK